MFVERVGSPQIDSASEALSFENEWLYLFDSFLSSFYQSR